MRGVSFGTTAVWFQRATRGAERYVEIVTSWVDALLHDAGLDLLVDRNKRRLSLVDAVSFVTMRRRHVDEAFAFDPHDEEEGFTLVA